jgi:hypothetical protein
MHSAFGNMPISDVAVASQPGKGSVFGAPASERRLLTQDQNSCRNLVALHMSPIGTTVWTGRALQARFDDLEVIGLALLYPTSSRPDPQHEAPANPYSAATRAASATGSTLAAQYLNSGILPNGSIAGLVSRFAAASTNANGMNTTPSGMASS